MPVRDDRGSLDREILDIIPERFDSDPDGRYARKGAHTRLILTVALALLAVAALGVAARHIFFGETPKDQAASTPVVKADDRPIKTRPADPGGMDVPNQDKLVYERMNGNDAEPQTESLLPPPEQPQAPQAQPRKPSIKPAFPAPAAKDATPPAKPATGDQPAAVTPSAPPASTATTAPAPVSPSATPANPPAANKQTAAVTPPPAAKPAAAPKAIPAAVAPPPAAVAKSAGGDWVVQLGALKTEADARSEWNRVRGANKDLVGELSSDIVRVDLGAKGVFWRLRAGPLGEAGARTLCAQLAKRNQGCLLAKK
jgi:cell division protein FtsN